MNIYTLKCVYFVYGGNTQMDNSQKKIIKYTVILAAAILLLNITGSHFFSAKSKDNTRSVVTVEAGSLNEKIPAVARNFEKKLEIVGVGYRFNVKGNEITVQDVDHNIIASHSGKFTTEPLSDLENTYTNSIKTTTQKIMRNGQLFILRDGKIYDVMGAEIK
mgnify:CR=1 FL=1